MMPQLFLKPPSTPHFPISGGERSEKKTCFAILLLPPCGSFSSRTSASAPSFPDWRREQLVIRGKIFCSLSFQGGSRELGLAVSGREGRKGGKWRRRRGGSLVYFPFFPRRGERGARGYIARPCSLLFPQFPACYLKPGQFSASFSLPPSSVP